MLKPVMRTWRRRQGWRGFAVDLRRVDMLVCRPAANRTVQQAVVQKVAHGVTESASQLSNSGAFVAD